MIRAIIFDCFGVLIADSLQIMRAKLAEENAEAAQEVKDLVGLVNKGILDPVATRPQIAKLFGITSDEYIQRVMSGEAKNHELMGYVRELRHDYKTAMLSNIGSGSLLKRFSASELEDHFDEVVASGEIGFAKPEARAYEIVAERLGVRLDECVFTDDRELFCEAARGVGMKAILFEDHAQFKHDLEKLLANN